MVVSATDIIAVDAGGRLFKTTRNTLLASGAQFFQAMLGQTGMALADGASIAPPAAKRARTEDHGKNSDVLPTVFVDCDPDIFADVLYYMRRNCIAPETKVDPLRLEKLKTEADFFCYVELSAACDTELAYLKTTLDASLREEQAYSGRLKVSQGDNDDDYVAIPEGHVLFVVSATLAGDCKVKRYSGHPADGSSMFIPGCYLTTCEKGNSGDFKLDYKRYDIYSRESCDKCCIAHLGMDQIHCGNLPMNMDFTKDLRLCISHSEDFSGVIFDVHGKGTWHIHYWVGPPDKIPQLYLGNTQSNAKDQTVRNIMEVATQNNTAETGATALGLLWSMIRGQRS